MIKSIMHCKIEHSLSYRRNMYMGLAILMVVCYHMVACQLNIGLLEKIFSYGLSGVDIFMLLSGLGLCFSIEKNSLQQFYTNRYTKILPLFWLLVIFRYEFEIFRNGNILSGFDVICMSTTLTFYGIGNGVFVDWYLNTIILLYLLFPFFYYTIKRCGLFIVFPIMIICVYLVSFTIDNWMYQSAIGRLPIFLFAIYIHTQGYKLKKKKKTLVPYVFSFIIVSLMHKNGRVYWMAPLMIFGLIALIRQLPPPNGIQKSISWVGKYTLEI